MLKRIVVHIDKDPACQGRVENALALARMHGAQVLGAYVNEPLFVYGYGESVLSPGLMELERGLRTDNRRRCEENFRRWTASSGVPAAWQEFDGRLEDKLPPYVRCSDLLVLSQADPKGHQSLIESHQLESVIMTAGRPIVALPYIGGKLERIDNLLVCWNGSREAARAVADAAPFLAKAQEIRVLLLDRDTDLAPGEAMNGLDGYLRAHGYVEARLVSGTSRGIGMGNAIVNAATDSGSDLVVMGFYGHSRAREWMLGGASREMLASMTVPVMFSH
ncbi:Universal stress protein family [Bordetella ansorpii]|uniref:Universal stress protein family n=1 Tax=Bordetella ansorpii TaxID=288768 RepID=A0A157SJQ2_9BORD|nr:universal stress protein [Bordetella ansorpii]SAI70491.1 Universal stress protein family [Bordetella ansorpii]